MPNVAEAIEGPKEEESCAKEKGELSQLVVDLSPYRLFCHLKARKEGWR
jgi:hypothetical protein